MSREQQQGGHNGPMSMLKHVPLQEERGKRGKV